MSTVTIRAEANAGANVPQRAATLIIDGVRVYTGAHPLGFSVDQGLIDLPPSLDDPGADKWKTYAPGIRTFTLEWGGVPVMVTTDPPERRLLDNGMIEWTWRDVEVLP